MSIDEVKKSLNDYFSDSSRPIRSTFDGLEELRDEIDNYLDALRCDIGKDEEE